MKRNCCESFFLWGIFVSAEQFCSSFTSVIVDERRNDTRASATFLNIFFCCFSRVLSYSDIVYGGIYTYFSPSLCAIYVPAL